MPYFTIATRSTPMPNAKPVHFSGSMPQLSKTTGWIIPQPRISIQPVFLQTLQPARVPSGALAERAADVDLGARLDEGEVARAQAHGRARAEEALGELGEHAAQVRHRDVRSTRKHSIWWNIGECVASSSRR